MEITKNVALSGSLHLRSLWPVEWARLLQALPSRLHRHPPTPSTSRPSTGLHTPELAVRRTDSRVGKPDSPEGLQGRRDPSQQPNAKGRASGFRPRPRIGAQGLFLALFVCGCGEVTSPAVTQVESPYNVVDQTARVLVLVEQDYVEPVERNRLLEGAVRGMVAELDPHSAYLPARDYSAFQADTEGRFGGIGVEVDFREDYVVVLSPIEGSPAERAGIKPGDRILAIDASSVRGKAPDELVALMRGKPGTKVTVTIRRPGEERFRYFTLPREIIKVTSVTAKRLVGDVGYIRLKQFQSGTHAELLEQVGKLREKGPLQGVLLDLRNNPGGLVNEASEVADEFLSRGTIYSTRHRGQIVDEVRASPLGALERGPVVILVNEYSASAAELLAGALQDNGRAVVVGTRTFGKGSVQTILDLPGGAGLKLTTMRYYTPRGRSIQAHGIEPNLRVEPGWNHTEAPKTLRESDLENHLPGEGRAEQAPHSVKPEDSASTQGTPAENPAEAASSKPIPDDPTDGADVALAVGYQILTGVLSRR